MEKLGAFWNGPRRFEKSASEKNSSGLVNELKFFSRTDIVGIMSTLKKSEANQNKLQRVEAALAATLNEVLNHGFFGMARIEFTIVDGTIHRITRSVERIEKLVRE